MLGTAAYMSPEQARGQPVDKRTDIWAFGCVLYEMLTGRRAFDGQTMSDTIARILEREPDWAALPRATPPPVRELLKRCLDKDPSGRPADLTSVRAIARSGTRAARSSGPVSRDGGRAGRLAGALALAALWWLRSDRLTPTGSSSWEQITSFPDSVTQPGAVARRQDARVHSRREHVCDSGEVYLKRLPDGDPTPLTSDGLFKMDPVFSPDGNRLAYTAVGNRSLRSRLGHLGDSCAEGKRSELAEERVGADLGGTLAVAVLRNQESAAHGNRHSVGQPCRPSRSCTSLSTGTRWHTDRPARLTDSGCSSSKWTKVGCSCRAGLSRGREARVASSGQRRAAARARRGRPTGGGCTFTADTGRDFHVWRQRFPDGEPEQVTAGGTTEEEGLAVAGDGRSLITSVGQQKRGVWIHDASGERQISLEGYAYWPLFSANGRTLCFRVTRSVATGQTPSELWMSDLESGRIERLLPSQLITQVPTFPRRSVGRVGPGTGWQVSTVAGVARRARAAQASGHTRGKQSRASAQLATILLPGDRPGFTGAVPHRRYGEDPRESQFRATWVLFSAWSLRTVRG